MKKLLSSCALIITVYALSIYSMEEGVESILQNQPPKNTVFNPRMQRGGLATFQNEPPANVFFNPYNEPQPQPQLPALPPPVEEEVKSQLPELPVIPPEPSLPPITPSIQPPEPSLPPIAPSSPPKDPYKSFVFTEKEYPEFGFEAVEPELQPQVARFSASKIPDDQTLPGSENDAIITFNNEPTTTKCIGLICVHGTFSSNKIIGADQNSLFSNALQSYAKKLAVDNNATVKMFMPQWSGELLTKARQTAANRIVLELERMDKERPFDELHGIGHSHGCNVLLNLSLIGKGDGSFSVRDRMKSLTLIAPPRVEFKDFYNYPPHCFVYAFNSRNDATQQFGSLERGQWFEQRIPLRLRDFGYVYNIEVEYLPEIGMPHHSSIKHLSLIDCLSGIQQLIKNVYERCPDLKLWITKNGGYRIALAINNDRGALKPMEPMMKKREIAETTSENVLAHLPRTDKKLMQGSGYILLNLIWEVMYTDPTSTTK